MPDGFDYDYVVVGSGFGGSVASLRLVRKGYKVLTIEQGRRFQAEDFPRTNRRINKWLWFPLLGWRGPFRMAFFRHVGIFSGVGVGGGSLVYASTLPVPGDGFFSTGSWARLRNWKKELEPWYQTARRMLGAAPQKYDTTADQVMRSVAKDMGIEESFERPWVSVFQGEPDVTVPDPYFDGEGPERRGCNQCARCMLGCPNNAKNTLDKNYLWLAEKAGLEIRPDTCVTGIRPLPGAGYAIESQGTGWRGRRAAPIRARGVVLAGGVLGTLKLLLRMQQKPRYLPRLSPRLGESIRTNNESLIGVVSLRKDMEFASGVTITSILKTDEHSHVEPVRFNPGSNLFRAFMSPHAPGRTLPVRLARGLLCFMRQPHLWWRSLFIRDFATRSIVLLYMRSLEGTLRFRLGRHPLPGFRRILKTSVTAGAAPTSFMQEATDLARRVAARTGGIVASMFTETLLNIPTTAHILGGCCMGTSADDGVIDHRHRVFGYDDLYVVDGSAVSANPGVNPSLTITAMAERAMDYIPARAARDLEEKQIS